MVVLGAGVAGLEAAFALAARLSGRVDLHVVCHDDRFVLRPNLVYVPFGGDLARSTLDLAEPLARRAILRERGLVEGVDAATGRVHLSGGGQVPYEHLVIATSAAAAPQEVPGLADHAVSVGEPAAMSALQEQAERANTELRELVQGIHPAGLARGLAVAVDELIERVRIPITVDVPRDRYRAETEANAYFLIAKALTNVNKRARSQRRRARLARGRVAPRGGPRRRRRRSATGRRRPSRARGPDRRSRRPPDDRQPARPGDADPGHIAR